MHTERSQDAGRPDTAGQSGRNSRPGLDAAHAAGRQLESLLDDGRFQSPALGSPVATGEITVSPTVTFGGSTVYFNSINTVQAGLKRTAEPSAGQQQVRSTWNNLAVYNLKFWP